MIQGTTITSVTPISACCRYPSSPNRSMQTDWISKSCASRPYSARNACSVSIGVRGSGAHLQLAEVEEAPMVGDHAAAEDQLEHVDRLVHASAAVLVGRAAP